MPMSTPLHVVEAGSTVRPAPEQAPDSGEAALLVQLEEQWAKLAAAEEALAEHERELAEQAETRA